MDPLTTSALISIGTALAAAAGSYGATKASLNGTKERVERIENKLDGYIKESHDQRLNVSERLSRVETKIGDYNG